MAEGEFGRRIKYFYEKYKDKYPKDVYLYAEFESWINEARKEFPKFDPNIELNKLDFDAIKLWFDKWFKKQLEKL